jgi:histidinol phosphatase-like PHP family hydrolase
MLARFSSSILSEPIVTCTRRTFLEGSFVTGATAAVLPYRSHAVASSTESAPPKPNFPVSDYHVHLSNTLTIDQALQLAKDRGVQLGILEHPGPGYAIRTDTDLQHYIDNLRKYPVRIGLQPVYAGWSKDFSKSVIDQLDYILMDAVTLPNPDGTWLAIWQIDTMVDDAEAFMRRYMQFIEQILTTEPIDIFGWPTFLPVPIARQYTQLWTPKRVSRVIDLCADTKRPARPGKKLAIEINEVAHVPDESFIVKAKQAGLKFTFGTDSRNQNAAHFYYCYQMAQKCELREGDILVVKRKS